VWSPHKGALSATPKGLDVYLCFLLEPWYLKLSQRDNVNVWTPWGRDDGFLLMGLSSGVVLMDFMWEIRHSLEILWVSETQGLSVWLLTRQYSPQFWSWGIQPCCRAAAVFACFLSNLPQFRDTPQERCFNSVVCGGAGGGRSAGHFR
jgi:hypothetical protein